MVTQKKWIPEPLLDELIEVADSAAALTEAIRSSNELPKHFPKSALLDICNSLGALKDGTLDGCRVPLEYAKARLPAIRREFIVRQVEDVDGSGTLEPTLQRGARVDIAFHQVIAAVATAWDEYRRTSTEDVSESEDIDPEVDSIHAVKSNVIEESIVVGKQLNERLEKIEGYSEQSSTNAEKLIRTIRDAENLNKLARAETQQRFVVPKWLKMLSAKMADMPAHLRTAANLIDASVDLSRPFRKYWSETSKEFRQYVAQRYKALAVLFRDFASELEQKKLNGQTSTKFGPDPEITNGFEHWLVEFIQSKRGDKAAIDPDLIFSEIKHITGENSSLYAKRHGYSSLKNMLKSLHLIKIIPKGTGYAVALHEDAERQKRLRTWRDRSIFILIVTSPWFFSAKNGDTVSFDRLAAFPIRRATGINDEITSYLKISGQSLKEMFSAVSGMSYISDANGGTFKIENIDLIRQRIYPASYKK